MHFLGMCSAFSILPSAMMHRRNYTNLDTLIFIVCLQCFNLVTCSAKFSTHPANKNVYEGTEVILGCTIKLKNFQTIGWFADSIRIRSNSRYTLTTGEVSTLNINYAMLEISQVETSDTGSEFYCAVFEEDTTKGIESQRAVLNITRVPQTRSPDCRRLNADYNEGDPVEVVCAQENTNPRVRLAIYKGNQLLSDTSHNSNTKQTFKYIARFEARRSDDGVIISCSQTPPTADYPQQFRRNCSFGNMNVNYAPTISINGATEITVDTQRKQQEVVYVCTGVAKPSIVSYDWIVTFDPDPTVTYYEQHNGNTLRLVFAPLTITSKVNLTCVGSNIVGRSSVSQILRVIHESNPTPNAPVIGGTDQEFTWSTALILAVTGSCGLCIALFTAVIIGFYHFQLPQSMDIYGERIAQPEVYFEPKDGISSPQIIDGKHSVGVQVSELTEIESVYTEVSEYGIKKEKDKTLPENNSYSHV